MANEITVKQLNVSSTLSSEAVDARDIFIGGKSITDAIRNPVKTVNSVGPDENGNIQIDIPIPGGAGEYTAFEVMPTTRDISADEEAVKNLDLITEFDASAEYEMGDIVKYRQAETEPWTSYRCNYGRGVSEDIPSARPDLWIPFKLEKIAYSETIPACNIHSMIVRTQTAKNDLDIVIDWGDGTVDAVRDLTDLALPEKSVKSLDQLNGLFGDNNTIASWNTFKADPRAANVEHNILLSHRYELDDSAVKSFIVKIYGCKYWAITHDKKETAIVTDELKNYTNLMVRVFDEDLPIASNVVNMSGFCAYAKRLTQISAAEYSKLGAEVKNTSGIFKHCHNLVNATGLKYFFNNNSMPRQIGPVFEDCKSLVQTDLRLPSTCDSDARSLRDMLGFTTGDYIPANFAGNVLDLLPNNGFYPRIVNVGNAFTGMTKLTCGDYTKLANILWNDTTKVFLNTSDCFTGCSSLDLSQIPKTWGGERD